MIADTPCAC